MEAKEVVKAKKKKRKKSTEGEGKRKLKKSKLKEKKAGRESTDDLNPKKKKKKLLKKSVKKARKSTDSSSQETVKVKKVKKDQDNKKKTKKRKKTKNKELVDETEDTSESQDESGGVGGDGGEESKAGEEPQQTVVFVGNVAWNTDNAALLEKFEGVTGIKRLTDKRGKFKGRVFLRFGSGKLAAEALAKAGDFLLDRQITVVYAKPELIPTDFENVGSSNGNDNASAPDGDDDDDDDVEDTGQTVVFVGNLSWEIDATKLTEHFQGVTGVHFLTDKRGKFKGRAFLRFATSKLAASALKRAGTTILEREITVVYAKPDNTPSDFEPVGSSSATEAVHGGGGEEAGDASGNQGGEGQYLFVSNLPFTVEESDVQGFFPNCTAVHWQTDKRGKFKGRAIVEFQSEQSASEALEKSGQCLLDRPIKVVVADPELIKGGKVSLGSKPAEQKTSSAPARNRSQPRVNMMDKPEGCNVVFVAGVSKDVEDEHMHELFKDCGEISEIRWIFDKHTGDFKQCGCVEFAEEDSVDKAILKAGEMVLGRPIRIKFAQPKGSRRR